MINRIYLTGLMGAGKSTVGKILARRLAWKFVDMDHEIESLAGKDIPKIFADDGEERFRDHEAHVLQKTTELENTVIACGGGVVTRQENVNILKNEFTAWLDLSPEEAARRLEYSHDRPLLSECKDTLNELNEILTNRQAAYTSTASIRINSGESSPENIATDILEELGR